MRVCFIIQSRQARHDNLTELTTSLSSLQGSWSEGRMVKGWWRPSPGLKSSSDDGLQLPRGYPETRFSTTSISTVPLCKNVVPAKPPTARELGEPSQSSAGWRMTIETPKDCSTSSALRQDDVNSR